MKRAGRLVGKKGLAGLMSNPQSTGENDHRKIAISSGTGPLYIRFT